MMEEKTGSPTPGYVYRVARFGNLQMEFDGKILRCTNLFTKNMLPMLIACLCYCVLIILFPVLSRLPGFYEPSGMYTALVLGTIVAQALIMLVVIFGVRWLLITFWGSLFENVTIFDAAAQTFQTSNSKAVELGSDSVLRWKRDRIGFVTRTVVWLDCPRIQSARAPRAAVGVFLHASEAERAMLEIAGFAGLKVVNEMDRKSD